MVLNLEDMRVARGLNSVRNGANFDTERKVDAYAGKRFNTLHLLLYHFFLPSGQCDVPLL